MKFAAATDGTRIAATPGAVATCPTCAGEVIAKCGEINIWHWAHRASDCDPWSEPMTRWHIDWQEQFPDDTREVTIGEHRADVRLADGTVIEFQQSSLSVDEIRAREQHYGPKMIWVFNAIEAYNTDRLNLRLKTDPPNPNYRTFRWKHPRRSLLACRRAVFLDLGDYYEAHDPILLLLKFMGRKAPYGGCGNVVAAREFVRDSRNRHNNALYDCENQKQPATGVQVETTTERKN